VSVIIAEAAFAFGNVNRVQIDHVPNSLAFRTALTPALVDQRARIHLDTRDPVLLGRIVTALEHTAVTGDARASDLRYAIRLRDARGIVRATLYLDAFGVRGVLDGRRVRFESDAIKRAIVAACASLAR